MEFDIEEISLSEKVELFYLINKNIKNIHKNIIGALVNDEEKLASELITTHDFETSIQSKLEKSIINDKNVTNFLNGNNSSSWNNYNISEISSLSRALDIRYAYLDSIKNYAIDRRDNELMNNVSKEINKQLKLQQSYLKDVFKNTEFTNIPKIKHKSKTGN